MSIINNKVNKVNSSFADSLWVCVRIPHAILLKISFESYALQGFHRKKLRIKKTASFYETIQGLVCKCGFRQEIARICHLTPYAAESEPTQLTMIACLMSFIQEGPISIAFPGRRRFILRDLISHHFFRLNCNTLYTVTHMQGLYQSPARTGLYNFKRKRRKDKRELLWPHHLQDKQGKCEEKSSIDPPPIQTPRKKEKKKKNSGTILNLLVNIERRPLTTRN